MRRRRKKTAAKGAPEKEKPAAEAAAESPGNGAEEQPTQYIFTFELIRQYPTIRSFIVKQQLKRSFGDTVSELIGGSKKGVYKF